MVVPEFVGIGVILSCAPEHAFFTTAKTPQIAWARDAAEDKNIVEEMLTGVKITVTAQAHTKTFSTDTYDLHGFPPAYTRMQALCKAHKQ